MGNLTPAGLAAIRDAVRFRDRCAAAVLKHYQRVDIAPSGPHARAAFDAIEPLIAARARAQVAEEIAEAIEAERGGGPERCDALDAAARLARQHAGSTQGPRPEEVAGV